jgi:tRNA/tmRNA/rRNA uracil-C5-methylase (TrmA/RlmC/RlmD family)
MKTTKRQRTNTTGAVPQKGDPGYLTPTQLRNRRKRRAKKQDSALSSSSSAHPLDTMDAVAAGRGGAKSTDKKKVINDPSMKYIHDPMNAPIVQAAKKFFKTIMLPNNNEFRIHVGPLDGWRTVAKLAVRAASSSSSSSPSTTNNPKAKVAIGLFLPKSHTLLPVPNCRAHHPSINHAVACIEKACHDAGVVPYQESIILADDTTIHSKKENDEKGTGQLRYVAINIARESGAAQITLVWNAPPPPTPSLVGSLQKNHHGAELEIIDDPVLRKLVSKLLVMSSANSIKNNPSNVVDDENDRGVTHPTSHCFGDPLPPKKRRRRGRQEGKCPFVIGDSTINDQRDSIMSNKNMLPKTSSKTKQCKQTKLNLHSLWVNYNQSWRHSNAIFAFDSTCWQHIYGPHTIIEHLNFDINNYQQGHKIIEHHGFLANPRPPLFSIPLHFPPNVFRQANLDSFTSIVGRIRERIQQFENNSTIACVELYGGVGTIGLHVSDLVNSLVSSDENPNNLKCFYDSVRELPLDIQSRLAYKQLNAADMVTLNPGLFQRCQVLIVDPPRKGLEVEVVNYLCKDGWKTMKLVVYVSCGFQAFQRDCEMMLKSERWMVEFAEAHLLFPGSDAIETLAFFVPL